MFRLDLITIALVFAVLILVSTIEGQEGQDILNYSTLERQP